MRNLVFALVAAFAVAGCNDGAGDAGVASPAMETAASPGAAPAEMAADAAAPPADQPQAQRPSALLPMMAYAYRYRLEAPVKRLPDLLARHEKACADAGAQTCQLVEAQITTQGEDAASGRLVLRATPAWLNRFRTGLQADAEGAGGRLADSAVEAEDLTRAIVDTEAALRAKKSLRDRLEALLASRPGKLQELLEVERELARVQGEIDATESELTVMRTRIATSRLTIDYVSQGVMAPDSAFRPLREAFEGVAGYFFGGLAAILVILAVLAPFALVFGPLLWFGLRWLRRRREARRAAEQPPA